MENIHMLDAKHTRFGWQMSISWMENVHIKMKTSMSRTKFWVHHPHHSGWKSSPKIHKLLVSHKNSQVGNFPSWPCGECLEIPIFALPHMGRSSSLSHPLSTWETTPVTPLSHVGGRPPGLLVTVASALGFSLQHLSGLLNPGCMQKHILNLTNIHEALGWVRGYTCGLW